MRAIIIDTETTGLLRPGLPLDQQPSIIELGALVVVNGRVESEHSWLINPGMPLPAIITKITGLTDADLVGKPTFKELSFEIAELFTGTPMVIAHNAPFDVGMLTNEFQRLAGPCFELAGTVVCTVQEYCHLFGHRPKLTQLYEKIMGVPLDQKHRAVDDCRAVYAVLHKDGFFKAIEEASRPFVCTLEDLPQAESRIVRVGQQNAVIHNMSAEDIDMQMKEVLCRKSPKSVSPKKQSPSPSAKKKLPTSSPMPAASKVRKSVKSSSVSRSKPSSKTSK